MKRIHWLASYPKSGNTWARALFSAYHRQGRVDINNMTHSVGDNFAYWYQVCAPKPPKELELADYLMVRPAAMLHLSEAQPGDPLLVKTHHCNALVDRCQLCPPQLTSSAIYLVRDPRDLAISWSQHLMYGIEATIDKMADPAFTVVGDNLPHVLGAWSYHVDSWLDEQAYPVAVVRYEDLVDDTEDLFAGMLKHVGVEPDAKRVRAAVDACRIERLREQEERDGFNEKRLQERFFNRGTHGHWRQVLSAEQARLIEQCHAQTMRRLGYEPEHLNSEAA